MVKALFYVSILLFAKVEAQEIHSSQVYKFKKEFSKIQNVEFSKLTIEEQNFQIDRLKNIYNQAFEKSENEYKPKIELRGHQYLGIDLEKTSKQPFSAYTFEIRGLNIENERQAIRDIYEKNPLILGCKAHLKIEKIICVRPQFVYLTKAKTGKGAFPVYPEIPKIYPAVGVQNIQSIQPKVLGSVNCAQCEVKDVQPISPQLQNLKPSIASIDRGTKTNEKVKTSKKPVKNKSEIEQRKKEIATAINELTEVKNSEAISMADSPKLLDQMDSIIQPSHTDSFIRIGKCLVSGAVYGNMEPFYITCDGSGVMVSQFYAKGGYGTPAMPMGTIGDNSGAFDGYAWSDAKGILNQLIVSGKCGNTSSFIAKQLKRDGIIKNYMDYTTRYNALKESGIYIGSKGMSELNNSSELNSKIDAKIMELQKELEAIDKTQSH